MDIGFSVSQVRLCVVTSPGEWAEYLSVCKTACVPHRSWCRNADAQCFCLWVDYCQKLMDCQLTQGPWFFLTWWRQSFAGMPTSLSGDSDSHLHTGGQTSHASVLSLETHQSTLTWWTFSSCNLNTFVCFSLKGRSMWNRTCSFSG